MTKSEFKSPYKTIVAFLIFVIISPFSFAEEIEQRYNEVFDGTEVRDQYKIILPVWAARAHRMQEFADSTYKEFKRGTQDSNSVGEIPRMITKAEYEQTIAGVRQRERAIQAFLKDHYSGKKRYAKSGIVSEEEIESIITRTGEHGYQKLINGDTQMNFLYGPDLVRDPQGKIRAFEDNLGFVGGIGDISFAQQIVEKMYPEIAQNYDYTKADQFFIDLVAKFREQAKKYGGKVVMYTDPNNTDDSEEVRTIEIFEKLGLEVVTPSSKRRLVYEKNGVYVQDENGDGREKVGFIFLSLEHSSADIAHPAAFEKAVIENAGIVLGERKGYINKEKRQALLKALKEYNPSKNKMKQLQHIRTLLKGTHYAVDLRTGTRRNHGMIDAILKGRVGSSYSPGVEFVGDKQFYTYMEKFIRFYLKEEPIIRNAETYMFNKPGTREVSNEVLDRIFGSDRRGSEIGEWVFKPVDGRGGDGIIFGKEIKPDMIPALIQKLSEQPHRYQAQRNTPPSLMTANRITDQRPLVYASREGSVYSPVPWSRASSLDRSRLMNVSTGGSVLGAFVVEPKLPARARMCREILKKRIDASLFETSTNKR